MNYNEFISNAKSLLIAPAGYGKTHLITECLQHTEGRQLILTHTHAGVASIKEKLLKSTLPTYKFNVETITSYAQKYVQSVSIPFVTSSLVISGVLDLRDNRI